MKMNYRTEVLWLDQDFPFFIGNGGGFSARDKKDGKAYMHNHYCLEINFCMKGTGEYLIDGECCPICSEDIFIINNMEYHMARNLSGDLDLMVLVFQPELILAGSSDYQYIRAFYEWKPGFKHRLPGEVFATDEIREILLDIQEEWNARKAGWRLMVKSRLLMVLDLIYRRFEAVEGYEKEFFRFQSGYMKLLPAVSYMEEHYAESISLSVLAQEAHMSKNYFSSLFSEIMNCTVSEYLLRMRLRNACTRLITGEGSILTAAMESGFGNISYFNRVFRRMYGISPGEYRKRMIEQKSCESGGHLPGSGQTGKEKDIGTEKLFEQAELHK